jgi:hypothetical protein
MLSSLKLPNTRRQVDRRALAGTAYPQSLASPGLRRSWRRAFRGYRMSPLRIIVSLVVALLIALAIVDFTADELQDLQTPTPTGEPR